MKLKLIFSIVSIFLFSLFVFADNIPGWPNEYQLSGAYIKKGKMKLAAESYYRAQLASSWAKKLQPSAFIGNGNDPGTARSALNVTIGQAINPWTFKDVKGRLVPILDKLEKEVESIDNYSQFLKSIYGYDSSSPQKKYPIVIPADQVLKELNIFAKDWIKQGRSIVKNK